MYITPLNNIRNGSNYQFGSKIPPVADVKIIKESAKSSTFFKPFTDSYNKFTDFIAEKFTSRFVEWKPLNYLADKLKNSSNLFQHCLTVGSAVTSGLYVQRTLTNKELDPDRRNTLAVNQGLTFAVSTAGAYLLDKYVKGWWDNVTARFAGHLLKDNRFYGKYLKDKEAIIKENKAILKSSAKGSKPELKSLPEINKLVEKHSFYKALDTEAKKVLMSKVKGMSPLRTMIIFGFVYRYFVPVAVTKPANKLCELYLEHKKAKIAQNNSVEK